MPNSNNPQAWPSLDTQILGPLCEALEDDAIAVLDEFLGDTPKLKSEIETALKNSDYPAIAGLTHQLKSSCGALGGTRVQNLSMYAEGQALAGSKDEIESSCQQLFQAIDELLADISQYRQNL